LVGFDDCFIGGFNERYELTMELKRDINPASVKESTAHALDKVPVRLPLR
jgi:hypothetical protein